MDLYAREGVAAACLELQELYRLDVNLLLFCFWHGSAYGQVSEELMQSVVAFSVKWRAQVVQPLRNARTWMKKHPHSAGEFDGLRERIKSDELLAEKIQQEQIDSLTKESQWNRERRLSEDDIERNIEKLLQAVEIERDEGIANRIRFIRGTLQS